MKHAIQFTSVSRASVRVHLPEGAKGDMCRAVQDDIEFGRWFLTGPNPVMLRRCTTVPTDRFPVTDDTVAGLLDRSGRLADEARVTSVCVSGHFDVERVATPFSVLKSCRNAWKRRRIVKVFKNALWTALQTILRPKMH